MIGYETQKPPMFVEGFLERELVLLSCDSGETRTHGQWLKRPLLYQLSYRVNKIILIRLLKLKITNDRIIAKVINIINFQNRIDFSNSFSLEMINK